MLSVQSYEILHLGCLIRPFPPFRTIYILFPSTWTIINTIVGHRLSHNNENQQMK
jgi:hypothetical protein